MFAAWVLLATAIPARPEDAAREMLKGAALYRSCQAELRLMDLPSLAQAKQPDLVDGSFCVGFVNGFTGNLSEGKNPACPHGESTGSVVREYVAYMATHPELLEQDRRVGLKLALQEAYPCPATQESPQKPSNTASRST